MEEKPRKKRKSGHEFRKEKEARKREDAVLSYGKITNFYGLKSSNSNKIDTPPTSEACDEIETAAVETNNAELELLEVEQNLNSNEVLQENVDVSDQMSRNFEASGEESNGLSRNEQDLVGIGPADFFKKPLQNNLEPFFFISSSTTSATEERNASFASAI